MIKGFLLSLFTLLGLGLMAQKNADCLSAILWTGQKIVVGETSGPGNNLEISGHSPQDSIYFQEENNTVWVRFIVPVDGEMTFDLDPTDPADDWDFLLFKAAVNQCAAIKSGAIKPIRSNLAVNDLKSGGRTGMKLKSNQKFVGGGPNSNFSKWLEVKKDEHYFLVFNKKENPSKGFKLNLTITPFVSHEFIDLSEADEDGFGFVDMTEEKVDENKIKMKFQLLDEVTKQPIEGEIGIVGVNWHAEDMDFVGKSEFEAAVPKEQYFFVNVKKEGYTFMTEKYKADESLLNEVQTIYITPLKKGVSIVLKEIVFRENTAQFLPSSINALELLMDFMETYPAAEIEIQGHVNAPGMDNDGKVKRFSLKRAEQIKEYLVDAGIDGRRIEVNGLGNEYMIYPSPANYEQEKANRRVEIKILSL